MKFTEIHYKVLFVADLLQDMKEKGLISGGYECVFQTKDILREGKLQGFANPTPDEIKEIVASLQTSIFEDTPNE